MDASFYSNMAGNFFEGIGKLVLYFALGGLAIGGVIGWGS